MPHSQIKQVCEKKLARLSIVYGIIRKMFGPALDLQLTGDTYVGKPSAIDQPTRPTLPFILSGSINE